MRVVPFGMISDGAGCRTPARILAADIGGTRSRFAFFGCDHGELVLHEVVRIATADATSFDDLLCRVREAAPEAWSEVVAHSGVPHVEGRPAAPSATAAFAIAGPVESGRRCLPPNISWTVDLDTARELPCHALLLNDFEAQGWACLSPSAQDLEAVVPGVALPGAPVAVLGAGTGLGKCLVLPGRCPQVLASEGGHATFPFEGRDEMAYADFVAGRIGGRIIGDVVLSGMGLSLLHAFHHGEDLAPRHVAARMRADGPVATWFARFYGRACRDWVLHTLARGGARITGGVAAANPCLVHHAAFLEAFLDCPTHAHLLRSVPVHLVRNPESGLWGAAMYALVRSMAQEPAA